MPHPHFWSSAVEMATTIPTTKSIRFSVEATMYDQRASYVPQYLDCCYWWYSATAADKHVYKPLVPIFNFCVLASSREKLKNWALQKLRWSQCLRYIATWGYVVYLLYMPSSANSLEMAGGLCLFQKKPNPPSCVVAKDHLYAATGSVGAPLSLQL